MKNFKEKCGKLTDWKGWKWLYYAGISLTIVLIALLVEQVILYSVLDYEEAMKRMHGKDSPNQRIFICLELLIILFATFLISINLKIKYFYKIFITPAMLLILMFFVFSPIFNKYHYGVFKYFFPSPY